MGVAHTNGLVALEALAPLHHLFKHCESSGVLDPQGTPSGYLSCS
jgi:hypothetical protein